MKRVQLIESLNVKEVTQISINDTIDMMTMCPWNHHEPIVNQPGEYLMADATVRKIECPIMSFRYYSMQKGGQADPHDLFIAVSPEVEKLLGVPMATMYRDIREMQEATAVQRRRIHDKNEQIEELQRINREWAEGNERFCAMPWWKRAWESIWRP